MQYQKVKINSNCTDFSSLHSFNKSILNVHIIVLPCVHLLLWTVILHTVMQHARGPFSFFSTKDTRRT